MSGNWAEGIRGAKAQVHWRAWSPWDPQGLLRGLGFRRKEAREMGRAQVLQNNVSCGEQRGLLQVAGCH